MLSIGFILITMHQNFQKHFKNFFDVVKNNPNLKL